MTKFSFFPGVFLSGFLTLVFQTLLFREFLAVFSGSELAIGVFFSSWLIFAALGALLAKFTAFGNGHGRRYFRYLPMIYIPAFFLQAACIVNLRLMAGVPAHELFPAFELIWLAFIINSPSGLISGFIFTRACRWFRRDYHNIVSKAYILEALGTFFGGLFTILAFAKGFSSETVFMGASGLAIVTPLLLNMLFRRHTKLSASALVLMAVFLSFQPDVILSDYYGLYKWRFFLGESAGYQGQFSTPESRYIFGEFQGKMLFVSASGQMESLPELEPAAEIAALHLAQRPQARNFLIIGDRAHSLINLLLNQPSVNQIDWFHPDAEYAGKILEKSSPDLRLNPNFSFIDGAIELALAEKKAFYDSVIINLPDPSTAALNRFFTREFYAKTAAVLKPDGLLGVRLTGAENALDPERTALGASLFSTLRTAFRYLTLKPGEETWFLASNQPLSNDLAVLGQNLRSINFPADLFTPERLSSLLPIDRIRYQWRAYANAASDMAEPVNSEKNPQAVLYSLMLSSRRSSSFFADIGAYIRAIGFMPLLLALFFFLTGRFLFMRTKPPTKRGYALFDRAFLIFSAGFAAISANIILLFLFQTVFGSLHLHVGVLSAQFMLGLAIGAKMAGKIFSRRHFSPRKLLVLTIILLGVFCFFLPQIAASAGFSGFLLLMFLAGLLSGSLVPAVTAELSRESVRDDTQAGILTVFDCLGGAGGAFLTGVFLVPCLGVELTAKLTAALVLSNLALFSLPERPEGTKDRNDIFTGLRISGFVVFPLLLWFFAVNQIQNYRLAKNDLHFLRQAAEQMNPGLELELSEVAVNADLSLPSFAVKQIDGGLTRVFSTEKIAPGITGYGGSIQLALHVNSSGEILDFRFLKSRETPSYIKRIAEWCKALTGRNISVPDSFAGVEAVSGATMTTGAVLRVLGRVNLCFTGAEIQPPPPEKLHIEIPVFILFCILSIILLRGRLFAPTSKIRFLYMLMIFILPGLFLNQQYSFYAVLAFLQNIFQKPLLSPGIFIIVAVPLLVLFFGNIYCGALCPFGALQELTGLLRRRFAWPEPSIAAWRSCRPLKYFLLFLLLLLFLTGYENVSLSDPLSEIFTPNRSWKIILWLSVILAAAAFYPRIWCRTLCPTGAFLSILGRFAPLRKIFPLIKPGRCHLGVTDHKEFDCIRCNRCLEPDSKSRSRQAKPGDDLFFLVLVALLCTAFILPVLKPVIKEKMSCTALSVVKGEAPVSLPAHKHLSGSPAKIDAVTIKKQIEEKVLSDKEARHYRKI
jgi:predicted membrane-bound spermidine synthase/Na+-translocating ferredoxin:NAD+ oxidoreductase RnfG subunit